MYKEHTRIDLVEGGNVFKQGDELTLAFKPRDEKGRVIDLAGKTIEGAIFSIKTGVIYEAPATWNASDQTIEFKIDELLDHGRFEIEFTATSTGYRLKIPSSGNSATLQIKPSTDDIDYVGVSKTTVTQLRQEQEAQQQQFEGVIVPKVNQIETQFNEVLSGATADGEVQAARVGPDATFQTIGQRMDATTTALADTGINAKSAGVVGDGITNDTTAIKNLISGTQSGELFFPEGVYTVTENLTIHASLSIRGAGGRKTIFEFPKGVAFAPIMLKGVENKRFSGFMIREKDHDFSSTASGVYLQESEHVLFNDVIVEGFANGFDISSGAGKAKNKDITLRKCRASFSGGYGIVTKRSDGVLLDDCIAVFNFLDGIKAEIDATNLTVRGGRSSFNGQSVLVDGSFNGNGFDGYAGADSTIIDGLIAEDNQGSGIYLKSGVLNNESQSEKTGVRNCEIRSVRCRRNKGSGLDINRVEGDNGSFPLVAQVNIFGGIFEKNTGKGIDVRARNVSMFSPICKENDEEGISLAASSYGVSIFAPIVIANGKKTPGAYAGIMVYGKKTRIAGGVIDGAVNDFAVTGDFAPATKYHDMSIRVAASSDDTGIRDVVFLNNNFSHDVRIDGGAFCIVHYGRRSAGYATFGSEGSTVTHSGRAYTKTTPSTDASAAGWDFTTKKMTALANSSATDVATLKNDYNALLAKLRAFNLLA